jgi:transcription elongation factor GreA
MTVGAQTLGEAIIAFHNTLDPEERNGALPELNRFVRWFGADQPIGTIDARVLESYQEQVALSGADQARRLEPLKTFLTYAQRQGLISSNLAKYLKLKRSATRRDAKKSEVQLGAEVTHLTAEGYDKLKEELDRLVNVERAKVAHDLWEARQDKDIRENAPYDAAKQHQALVEARIRELEHVIATASIIGSGNSGSRITVGSTVLLRDLAYDEELSYTLVGPQEANPRAGRISIVSPVGKALLDRIAGDVIEVEAPVGTVKYRVERIER